MPYYPLNVLFCNYWTAFCLLLCWNSTFDICLESVPLNVRLSNLQIRSCLSQASRWCLKI